ncbi:alcohol dehydrogenase catalytic domain-containing protein [Streptomyces mirabilis]|uniref:alcohol dehydrogenase catalytic domain-containing protein n=1 Tax=Streptomyces mirabilis TaxID=68239 RepID=UPI00366A17A4
MSPAKSPTSTAAAPPATDHQNALSTSALPPLPHRLGARAVGRISAVGSDVKHLGDRTLVPPLSNACVRCPTRTSTASGSGRTRRTPVPDGR